MWTILKFKVNEFVHTSFAAAVRCSLQHGIVHIYSPGSLLAAFLQLQPSCVRVCFVCTIQKRRILPLAVLWACFFCSVLRSFILLNVVELVCDLNRIVVARLQFQQIHTHISFNLDIFVPRAASAAAFRLCHSVLSLFSISHTPCVRFFLDSLCSRWICQWSIEQNEMQHVCLWQSTRARFFFSSFSTMRFSMVPLL